MRIIVDADMSSGSRRPFDDNNELEGRNVRARQEAIHVDEKKEVEFDYNIFCQSHEDCWQTERGTYKIRITVKRDFEYHQAKVVDATLHFQEEKIGRLKGTVLPRPSRKFYAMGNVMGAELSNLTCMFCDCNGAATRIPTNLEGKEVFSGGFFFIDLVEIQEAHKGHDLGLRMLHEAFVYLKEDWNLAVMEPRPMNSDYEDRLQPGGIDPFGDYTDEEIEIMRQASLTIARHWARMGFQQAGRNLEECDAWYMTSATYFRQDGSSPCTAINRWKTKSQVQNLDIYVPPEKHYPQGLDEELQSLVYANSGDLTPELLADVIHQIEDLVRRGASIHGSRALHVLAANADGKDMTLLETLVRLGADVNAPNEFGIRPLHAAASQIRSGPISSLIKAGADPTLKNGYGFTPLECLEKAIQNSNDFKATFSLKFWPIDLNPCLGSSLSLMPHSLRTQLIDGWMPPRMFKMLEITARVGRNEILYSIQDFWSIQNRPPTLLPRRCGIFGMRQFKYIPADVLQRIPRRLYKSFFEGWAIIWETIMDLICKKKQVPTLSRVKGDIIRFGDTRRLKCFVEKGGQIKFALDALLRITQNVHVDGTDGWAYSAFKREIESFPATPLDRVYDLMRLKCLELRREDFVIQKWGPFLHNFD